MKLLSVLATLVILTGIIGVVTKDVKRRMIGISLTVAGMLLLANVQGGVYGIFSGVELLLFQLPTLILFLIAFGSLCKKNKITLVSEFVGFRKSHPWVLLLFLIMGVILIGIPGTGTFGAYMIEINAILSGADSGVGIFQLVSLAGMIVGIAFLGIQFFDIWIHMILMKDSISEEVSGTDTIVGTSEEIVGAEEPQKEEIPGTDVADKTEEEVSGTDMVSGTSYGLSKVLLGIEGILLLLLILLGVFQSSVVAVISLVYQALK